MLQKSIDKYHEMRKLIEDGLTVEDAAKKVGVGMATYYLVKKALDKEPKQVDRRSYKKKAKFVDVPLKTTSTNVAIVVCQPSQLKDVLAGLS